MSKYASNLKGVALQARDSFNFHVAERNQYSEQEARLIHWCKAVAYAEILETITGINPTRQGADVELMNERIDIA